MCLIDILLACMTMGGLVYMWGARKQFWKGGFSSHLNVGSGESNPGPHTCVISTLLTELFA